MSDIKLVLGVGPLPIHPQHLEIIDSSWTLTDLLPTDPSVKKMDARHIDYLDNSVSCIYASHLLEHIGLREIPIILTEWKRALKPGGDVIINVPDMEWLAQQILDVAQNKTAQSSVFNTPQKLMEVVYGNQDDEGEYHKSGFTEISLMYRLIEAGFKNVTVKKIYEAHEMGCLVARGYK